MKVVSPGTVSFGTTARREFVCRSGCKDPAVAPEIFVIGTPHSSDSLQITEVPAATPERDLLDGM